MLWLVSCCDYCIWRWKGQKRHFKLFKLFKFPLGGGEPCPWTSCLALLLGTLALVSGNSWRHPWCEGREGLISGSLRYRNIQLKVFLVWKTDLDLLVGGSVFCPLFKFCFNQTLIFLIISLYGEIVLDKHTRGLTNYIEVI